MTVAIRTEVPWFRRSWWREGMSVGEGELRMRLDRAIRDEAMEIRHHRHELRHCTSIAALHHHEEGERRARYCLRRLVALKRGIPVVDEE